MAGRLSAAVCCALALIVGVFAAEPDTETASELLIVMTDGRVVRGVAERHAAGYFLDRSGGRVLVPHEQIRCVARNLPDAYRQQRESMVNPTSASLIALAEWCIAYHLYDEAGDELRRALRRDPHNDIARKMLARVQEQLLATPAKALEKPHVARDGSVTPEVESLGGLSRETAATFSTRIQPLLMNKCGNANCHGSECDNGFRLNPVRVGAANHRRSAELNLALVLKFVNVEEPHRSPLLMQVRNGHGGAAATLFGGAQGAAQLKLLSDWVQSVSNERLAEQQRAAKWTPLKNKPRPAAVEPAVATTVPPAEPVVQPAAFATEAAPHLLVSGTRPVDEPPAPVDKAATPSPKRRTDRFDPAAFNEQFSNRR